MRILSLFFTLLTSVSVIAQTYLQKDFNDLDIYSGGWQAIQVVGTLNWHQVTFGGTNHVVGASNYNGSSNELNECWYISPGIDLTTSNTPTLSFLNMYEYTGDPLEIYVSTDYDGISAPATATWTQLQCNLSPGGWTKVSSGNVDLSNFKSSNTYIGFKYTGTAVDGSTWELDDILVNEDGYVIFEEDFGNGFPSGWSNISNSGSSDVWQYTTTGAGGPYSIGNLSSTTEANGYMKFDSDSLCSGDQNADLITGPINCSVNQFVQLKFEQHYRKYYDSTFVYVSNDNITWDKYSTNADYTNTQQSDNPDIVEIDISSTASLQPNVYIKWNFWSPSNWAGNGVEGCGYAWMIDDIKVSDLQRHKLTISDARLDSISELEYYKLTEIQATNNSLWLNARVQNGGVEIQTNTHLEVWVDYNGTTNPITGSFSYDINPGQDTLIGTIVPLLANNPGSYKIKYLFKSDFTVSDTLTKEFRVGGNEYSRDTDNTIGANILNQSGTYKTRATEFKIYQTETFSSISAKLGWVLTAGDSIQFNVYDDSFSTVDSTYYVIQANDINSFVTAEFVSPLTLNPGDYLMGITNLSNNDLYVLNNRNTDEDITNFIRGTNNTWYWTTSVPILRLNTGIISDTKAGIIATTEPQFSQIPLKHAKSKFIASVKYEGPQTTNINIPINVNNGLFLDTIQINQVNWGDSTSAKSTNEFQFPSIGSYSIKAHVISDIFDQDHSNDTTISSIDVTDTIYAVDNGNLQGFHGWIFSGATSNYTTCFGTKIELNEWDTLTSFAVYIGPNAVIGEEFSFSIHKMIDSMASVKIHETNLNPITSDMINSWTTHSSNIGYLLEPGEYMISFNIPNLSTGNGAIMGIDNNPNGFAYQRGYYGNSWIKLTSILGVSNTGTNMIRCNFGRNKQNITYMPAVCDAPVSSETLDINNVSALLSNDGNIWKTDGGFGGGYEVPKASGLTSIYTGGIWIGGYDFNNDLRLAGNMYTNNGLGSDYYAGPLDTYPVDFLSDTSTQTICSDFDRMWKINKTMIDSFINGLYLTIPIEIMEWPGRGNPNLSIVGNRELAPFVDVNNDGIYVPQVGDYPNIKGDQAIWYVINDGLGVHPNSNGLPIGVEIHVMAYAYNSIAGAVNNTTFYQYSLFKRSAGDLDSTYIGFFVDPDLGFYGDDYVGCDTTRSLGFCYNGDDFDENKYEFDIPILGVTMVDEPKNAQGEKVGMSSFVYFNSGSGGVNTDPINAEERYGYMNSVWRDGQHMVYGGDAHPNSGGTTETNFMFPSNPSDGTGWSECTEGNTPADRRFAMSFGPITLFENQASSFTSAVVWQPNVNYSSCTDISDLQAAVDTIKNLFDSTSCDGFSASSNLINGGCYGQNNAVGTAIVSGGAPPYFYNWSDGATTKIISGLSSQTYQGTVTDALDCEQIITLTVPSISGPLSASPSIINETCFDASDGAITANVADGTPPYQYSWSNGGSGSVITNLHQGNYGITIEDRNGCEFVDSYTVSGLPEIIITSSVTNTTCGNNIGEINTTVTGGVSPYQIGWSNGSTQNDIDSLFANLYVINITDTSGCTLSKTFSVNDNDGPLISVTSITQPSCTNSDDGYISINVTNGTAPYNILWSNGSTSNTLINLQSGIYDVEVSDQNGCLTFASTEIIDPAGINPNISVVGTGCGLSTGSAVASPTGGTPPYSYVWTNGSTSNSISSLDAQLYYVNVIDANGCNQWGIAAVNETGSPEVLVDSIFGTNCGLDNGAIYTSISGGLAPYSLIWSNSATASSLTGLANGTYAVTCSGINGCTSYSSFEVIDNATNPDEICMVTVDTITRTNQIIWEKSAVGFIDYYNVYVESSGGNSYLLIGTVPYDSAGFFTDSIANPSVKSYRYKISYTDTCGLESSLSTFHKTIHLTMSQGIIPGEVNLGWDNYVGYPFDLYYINRFTDTQGWELIDSVSASANNYYTYTDTPPFANELFYSIEAKHPFGCNPEQMKASNYSASRSNRPNSMGSSGSILPVADFQSNFTNIPIGGSVSFGDLSQNNPTSWSWSFSGGVPFISSDQNPTNINYSVAGSYDVTLIVSNAVGSDTITKYGYINVGSSGIEEYKGHNVMISPNPNEGVFTVSISTYKSQSFDIQITNSIGQELTRVSPFISNSYMKEFDFSKYSAGTYFVRISSQNEVENYKVIIH